MQTIVLKKGVRLLRPSSGDNDLELAGRYLPSGWEVQIGEKIEKTYEGKKCFVHSVDWEGNENEYYALVESLG